MYNSHSAYTYTQTHTHTYLHTDTYADTNHHTSKTLTHPHMPPGPLHPSRRLVWLSRARLQRLEQEMVGGEQARNQELQRRHRQRKTLADQRKKHLIKALSQSGEDSDYVLLNVYDSIQEEVHAKRLLLDKTQGKVGEGGSTHPGTPGYPLRHTGYTIVDCTVYLFIVNAVIY